jgi:UTP--glucose-1-phosphate uridylyltransferase
MENHFAEFNKKMLENGVAPEAIAIFKEFYRQLFEGSTGYISAHDALPIETLPHLKDLMDYKELGKETLNQTISIKLNGGLGTSMGLDGPKSLLKAKNGLNFLEITINQIFTLRKTYGSKTPLIFMNSFSTDTACKLITDAFNFKQNLPISFTENKVPKILKDSLKPATYPQNPINEWSPPGHGDIFPTLYRDNLLNQMIQKGYKYALISNTDNLGAIPDPAIAGYMEATKTTFLMEVAIRTPNDKKGGHLAQNQNGQLMLREAAQCPPEETDDFQNIDKYKFFNTNNIWINLEETKRILDENNGYLDLPIIINEKNLIPTDLNSPKVYQLESAMGSAIQKYKGAKALVVDKQRFAPIKKQAIY